MRSLEELNGIELREAKRLLGGTPLTTALETDFEEAVYVAVFIAEKRDNPDLTRKDVLERPFGEILETFRAANEADPTDAESGSG